MNSAVLTYHSRRDARRRDELTGPDHAALGLVPNLEARRDAPGSDIRIVVQARPDDAADIAALRAGLLASPASSSPKFFYDIQGSALFSAICALDEYYPTRTEAAIFARDRAAIADKLPRAAQWIDLGCGDCAKSRDWLGVVQPSRFIGVDIADAWLRTSLAALAHEFPRVDQDASAIEFVGAVTDFTRPFDLHALLAERPDAAPVFFYPGSSIGNFAPAAAREFLIAIREHIAAHPAGGGCLLVGIDLVKDVTILEAAYDDAIGVTAAFNRNVLRVANRMLDADFDPASFAHRAVFDTAESRIEMHLVAKHAHDVRIGADIRHFGSGEAIVTEYSYKYTPEAFASLLVSAGFSAPQSPRMWSDERGWFGIFLAAPA